MCACVCVCRLTKLLVFAHRPGNVRRRKLKEARAVRTTLFQLICNKGCVPANHRTEGREVGVPTAFPRQCAAIYSGDAAAEGVL